MSLILTDSQQAKLTIEPVDKAGNPAPVEGVVWTTSDATILTVAAAADGLSAVVASTGKLGTVQVNVTGDAQIGVGDTEIAGVLDVEVKAGQAVSLNIAAGAPEEKP
jgi:hypothetical protein